MMNKLRVLHRWVGLVLVLPMVLQGISGLIIAAAPPFNEATRPLAKSDAPQRDFSEIVDAARKAGAADQVPARLRMSGGERQVAIIDMAKPPQRMATARIFIDPGSLEILEVVQNPDDVVRFAHRLHETLLIAGPLGHSIIGWFGIGLLFIAVTGIPLWWPRQGRVKAAFIVSPTATGYRFQRELHGAAGIWLLAILLLQSLSGASMAFPETARAIVGLSGPQPRGGGMKLDAAAFDVDEAARQAEQAAPQAHIRDIRLPLAPGQPAAITLLPDGSAARAPTALVRLDASGHRVLGVEDPRTAAFGVPLLGWMRALHSGGGLGPVWTLVICIAGLALPLSAVTGFTMWLLRRRNLRLREKKRQEILQAAE
ncbi:MAG TPA: PepSY-associated TM helix domain-containing protein [Aliidongia sp.]|nr:PepSY-associated TM helix domain-containing protein [Aliidongia sp.]